MNLTQVALITFVILFSWIIPAIIKKNKIEDNIKLKNTLPIGTAKFKAFIVFIKWLLISFGILWLVIYSFELLGS